MRFRRSSRAAAYPSARRRSRRSGRRCSSSSRLAHLVGPRGRVTTVDVDADTARRARRALRGGGYRVRVIHGDGREAVATRAPFDRIIVTASAETVPHAWFEQVVAGGLSSSRCGCAKRRVPTSWPRSGRWSADSARSRSCPVEAIVVGPDFGVGLAAPDGSGLAYVGCRLSKVRKIDAITTHGSDAPCKKLQLAISRWDVL